MTKNKISLLLLTKNESHHIQTNFSWLKECPVIDEVVVVDDNSTDDTINQVKKLSTPNLQIDIYHRSLDSDFSAQREFGLSKTKNDWVLWLDPDETPQKDFIQFLNNFKFDKPVAFKRLDVFLGHTLNHGETSNQYFLRLFNKTGGKFIRPVHEVWNSTNPVVYSDIAILHHSHPTLKTFLQKINFYTDIRCRELYDQKVTTNLFQIVFYPTAKFIQNYFFRLGFLDSTPGIIMALGMSFHSFLVRAKLWHLYQQS